MIKSFVISKKNMNIEKFFYFFKMLKQCRVTAPLAIFFQANKVVTFNFCKSVKNICLKEKINKQLLSDAKWQDCGDKATNFCISNRSSKH